MEIENIIIEFLVQYVQDNVEHIDDIDDLLKNDEFYNDFFAYIENPNNGYRYLMYTDYNKNVKSAYVRYCNKMIKKYELNEFVKYNVKKNELIEKMVKLVSLNSWDYIVDNMI